MEQRNKARERHNQYQNFTKAIRRGRLFDLASTERWLQSFELPYTKDQDVLGEYTVVRVYGMIGHPCLYFDRSGLYRGGITPQRKHPPVVVESPILENFS
jgi:hypothetical protein